VDVEKMVKPQITPIFADSGRRRTEEEKRLPPGHRSVFLWLSCSIFEICANLRNLWLAVLGFASVTNCAKQTQSGQGSSTGHPAKQTQFAEGQFEGQVLCR
jgi:hypothetical protein